ncbi:haloacid dehalogenase [Ammoniphilus oxalaticus]|uniref:Haloacid dehalogenase n=1 Tax=Ammoniphilus oxalaticus TaxID=66863 RepID=A0A419SG61_9BACL|nr:HAD hydrolase-like protein [Ammoniphilus oxalaticus]RKD22769.1 haloacid dehalogenase [Ammoniphilus oxalaticus]
MNPKIPFAAIFDMDGTLFKTEDVAVPAFKRTFEQLKKKGYFEGEVPSDEELMGVFGMTLDEIWDQLLPGCSASVKEMADEIMLREELNILKEGNAALYPGVKETLAELNSRGVPMFIASNGLEAYIAAICDHFGISKWFKDQYSAGRFLSDSKDQLVAKLLADYSIEDAVMVGDRHSDVQAGKMNNLFTVGCAFGFADEGELAGADQIVTDFRKIAAIIERKIGAQSCEN